MNSALPLLVCSTFWDSFSGVGLGPLLPVKVNLNASEFQDILANTMLPTLW